MLGSNLRCSYSVALTQKYKLAFRLRQSENLLKTSKAAIYLMFPLPTTCAPNPQITKYRTTLKLATSLYLPAKRQEPLLNDTKLLFLNWPPGPDSNVKMPSWTGGTNTNKLVLLSIVRFHIHNNCMGNQLNLHKATKVPGHLISITLDIYHYVTYDLWIKIKPSIVIF